MTTTLRVRFDGKVLVPEGPVDLPIGPPLEVRVSETVDPSQPAAPLEALAAWASRLPPTADTPTDRAAQHDHYLYGMPKRP